MTTRLWGLRRVAFVSRVVRFDLRSVCVYARARTRVLLLLLLSRNPTHRTPYVSPRSFFSKPQADPIPKAAPRVKLSRIFEV